MKRIIYFSLILAAFTFSCKKEQMETVETNSAFNIADSKTKSALNLRDLIGSWKMIKKDSKSKMYKFHTYKFIPEGIGTSGKVEKEVFSIVHGKHIGSFETLDYSVRAVPNDLYAETGLKAARAIQGFYKNRLFELTIGEDVYLCALDPKVKGKGIPELFLHKAVKYGELYSAFPIKLTKE